eukprot:6185494-Pleurochrysis_carterae.AAC.4
MIDGSGFRNCAQKHKTNCVKPRGARIHGMYFERPSPPNMYGALPSFGYAFIDIVTNDRTDMADLFFPEDTDN